MHPDEKRLPLAFLPGFIACPPRLNCVEAAPYVKELPPAPLSSPSASSSRNPSTGAVGTSGNCRYRISPALKLRLQRSPSSLRRHPSTCIRSLFLSKSSLPSAVTVTIKNILPFMCRSVFYPLAYSVARLVASLHSYLDCARTTTPMCLSSPMDASVCQEIPLALVGDIEAHHDTPGRKFPCPRMDFSPYPYSVTGFVIWHIGDSYLLGGVMELARPFRRT